MEGEFPQPHSVLSLPSLHYQNLFTSCCIIPLLFAHLLLLHFFPFSFQLQLSFFLSTPSTAALDTQSQNSSRLGLLPVHLFSALAQFSHTNICLSYFVQWTLLSLPLPSSVWERATSVEAHLSLTAIIWLFLPSLSLSPMNLSSFFLSFPYFQY